MSWFRSLRNMLLRLHNAQGAIPAADGSLATLEVFKQAYEQPLTRIISHTGGQCASSCPPHQVFAHVLAASEPVACPR